MIAILAAAGYGLYAFLSRGRTAPFQNISINKITETGKAALVAISPDARYILNVVNSDGLESLWLRNVPTNSNTQVVAPEPVHYLGLRFSADGNYIYFVRSESGSQELEFLYRAPVLGGTPQRLITDIDSNITFSPDGRQYAYVIYNNPDPYKYRLIIHSLEGNEQRVLATGPVSSGLYEPAWSPDGKTIVCYAIRAGRHSHCAGGGGCRHRQAADIFQREKRHHESSALVARRTRPARPVQRSKLLTSTGNR